MIRYSFPQPTEKQLAALRKKEQAKYGKHYFEEMYWIEDIPEKKHYREFHYNDPTHEKRFRYLANVLEKYVPFESILDAGCGTGHLVRNLLEDGYNVKGVEASKDALRHYMDDLTTDGIVIEAGLERLPFSNNTFDLVFCSDVLEHILIFDIPAVINEFIRVTKKYLVLTINLDHPYEYHPTILSRGTWETLFLATRRVRHSRTIQQRIEEETKQKYNEYDWFVFRKI